MVAIISGETLGRMCLMIMCLSFAPMALASTYARSFKGSVHDLTSLTTPVQPVIEMARTMMKKLCMTKIAIRRISSELLGRIMNKSMKCINIPSTAVRRRIQ